MHTPHIYLWDGNGEVLTDEVLDNLISKHKDWYTEERIAIRRSLCNRNIRGWLYWFNKIICLERLLSEEHRLYYWKVIFVQEPLLSKI